MTTLIVQPNRPVYLDYAATTPVDQRVAAKMIPYLSERFGNPASRSHAYGWAAEEAVELAREPVALLNGTRPPETGWHTGHVRRIRTFKQFLNAFECVLECG